MDEALLPGSQPVLLCAPAGFGETTLLADWLGARPQNACRLPLDAADNMPACFPSYVIAAIQQSISGLQFNGGCDSRASSFVTWLGTICYLTRDSIEETFASLAIVCAPGSRIAFDYFLPETTMSPADVQLFETLDEGGRRRGEPMQTLLDAEQMAEILLAAGFRVIEDLSAAEIRRRYLAQMTDGLDIPSFARLCCAERAA